MTSTRLADVGSIVSDKSTTTGKPRGSPAHLVGRVIAPGGSQEAEMETTKAIKEFNQALFASKDFFATLLPLRDGVSVGLKL